MFIDSCAELLVSRLKHESDTIIDIETSVFACRLNMAHHSVDAVVSMPSFRYAHCCGYPTQAMASAPGADFQITAIATA